MIKKIHCKCVKRFDDNYIFLPHNSIKDDELLNNYIHKCINYDLDCIFDFRNIIINNNINGQLYFYARFLIDKDTYINIDNFEVKSFVYEFNRLKNKKELEYSLNLLPFSGEINNKNIYLGKVNINFRNIAYETMYCCNNSISKSGQGFYGFNLISDTQLPIYYSEIIISDKPLFCNNISLPPYNEVISEKGNNPPPYENVISENRPEPSAPPIEY